VGAQAQSSVLTGPGRGQRHLGGTRVPAGRCYKGFRAKHNAWIIFCVLGDVTPRRYLSLGLATETALLHQTTKNEANTLYEGRT
jgi:hypothetical protein